ncbi:F-box protein: endocytic membrane traffic, recycling ReCYcling 1 [Elasticomyces elasticus]|nr:F-box protein: endocytic membrane traffic, recycling ReCYcling 1 [Elasticomyces elasticus]
MANLRKIQMDSAARSRNSVLASLKATQIVASKPVLPAELIATILDYLPVQELLRFARVSKRMQEMVYDDTRWQQKLRGMGLWNEAEARQRAEEGMRRKMEAQRAREVEESRRTGAGLSGSVNGIAGGGSTTLKSTTLYDANVEETRYHRSVEQLPVPRPRESVADGFDDMTLSPDSPTVSRKTTWDPASALGVLNRVRSVRGYARQEYGKIYGALAPFYFDLVKSETSSERLIFRTFNDPEQQAQVLTQLKVFALNDTTQGWQQREEKLESMTGIFENAVLQEFEQAYEAQDVDSRMRRFAHVLVALNGGVAAIDVFIQNHPLMLRRERLGNPLDCIDGVAYGHVDLQPSGHFFQRLGAIMNEQSAIIDRVFPHSVDVLLPFLTRVAEDVISAYITTLFDEAHEKNLESYLKAVPGIFEQSLRFAQSIRPTRGSASDFLEQVQKTVMQCFEPHVDLYLSDELGFFNSRVGTEVAAWEKQLSEQEASTESFFMSNINRQAAKRDFLASFKKVVMMPVNVLPAFPRTNKSAQEAAPSVAINGDALDSSLSSRPGTPSLNGNITSKRVLTPPVLQAPTNELAAKAAIMNSRLEGIRSLFSIEVALNLIHYAKSSIERAAILVKLGGQSGEEAREQCETVFVQLLHILGQRHIKTGFDKAVGHLSSYKPREVREFRNERANKKGHHDSNGDAENIGLEPLVTFLELVNVGDLIQQMVDVFYAQELVANKLTDRDDFLDPAVKEKKRFEQMLDERVAAGLNKGIDVLMDEVEYVCATTQLTSDYNPLPSKDGVHGVMDIGPSSTAKQVVQIVDSHTGMLVGSTDKNMLDVFNQEVGLRLFGVICKHLKRQRISVDGAIKLISDINHYSNFVASLRQKPLLPYFSALRELSQIYLIECTPSSSSPFGPAVKLTKTSTQAKELATIIADTQRYRGIFAAEEVYEFAERRADWYAIKRDVERAMYGIGCVVM